jgi:hypothetical protein
MAMAWAGRRGEARESDRVAKYSREMSKELLSFRPILGKTVEKSSVI